VLIKSFVLVAAILNPSVDYAEDPPKALVKYIMPKRKSRLKPEGSNNVDLATTASPINMDKLVNALWEREMGTAVRKDKWDSYVGDRNLKNKAYGPGQIRQTAIDDLKKSMPSKYPKGMKAKELLNNNKLSRRVTKDYLNLIATRYRKDPGITRKNLFDVLHGYNAGPKAVGKEKYKAKPVGYAMDVIAGYTRKVGALKNAQPRRKPTPPKRKPTAKKKK